MSEWPCHSRAVRLAAHPEGLPRPEHFEIVSVPLAAPAAGEVLVRNRYFRVAASLRMMIAKGAAEIEGVPLPALRPGDALADEALGEIVAAPPGSGLACGDWVLHPFGWREYAAIPADACVRVGDVLPSRTAHLGHGATAYAALTRGVRILPGDTVFITSAAGAVGSMAGQIARLLGAARVIGSTGSIAKANRLTSELGYDAVVVRGERPLAEQLREVAPEGLDVVIDTVGGEQLQIAIGAARNHARVLVLGALSGQLAASGSGRVAPVELDSFQLLLKKITIRGYSADDDPDALAEWLVCLGGWLRTGDIRFPHVVIDGLDAALGAIQGVAEGRYFGTVLVGL
ncbi:MDR family NADP-dependent oxidoreductase [Burkholderia alba]|uniref:MDR family NADP-dependent oxidoreductase n=1 Tax=Burkholderia alba TaxID=2683677 RepID=UPI002B052B9C|nr:NADP-dependent oxidoreductase [Burkholderia alba]